MALKFALFGAGFWSQFQLAGWKEIPGVECVAIYNRTRSRAEALAARFGVPAVYDDPVKLLDRERIDFVDIVTGEDTHASLTLLAASRKLPVICQKPLARSVAEAVSMVEGCRKAGVPLFVHENWRFQTALRALNDVLQAGTIGEIYRARLDMRSGFPVTQNQPFLATLEKFIICDVGSHTLDTARWLFGEPEAVFTHLTRVQPHLKGEDVATIFLRYPRLSCTVNMSYASNYYEHDRFPETFGFVEGSKDTAGKANFSANKSGKGPATALHGPIDSVSADGKAITITVPTKKGEEAKTVTIKLTDKTSQTFFSVPGGYSTFAGTLPNFLFCRRCACVRSLLGFAFALTAQRTPAALANLPLLSLT